MWPFQNTVGIIGWVEEILISENASDFAFRLLQPGYHEHFHSAFKNRGHLLTIEVRAHSAELARQCHEFLATGHRVMAFGRMTKLDRADGREVIGLDAWTIERAEPLTAFRYINHRWQHELKPTSGETVC
jgi:hypothetical protein